MHVQHEQLLATHRAPDLTTAPRTISADGSRVFFSSLRVLAPGAEPGELFTGGVKGSVKTNVYEWENGARSPCWRRSSFSGASASANTSAPAPAATTSLSPPTRSSRRRTGRRRRRLRRPRRRRLDVAPNRRLPAGRRNRCRWSPTRTHCQGARAPSRALPRPPVAARRGRTLAQGPGNPCLAGARPGVEQAGQAPPPQGNARPPGEQQQGGASLRARSPPLRQGGPAQLSSGQALPAQGASSQLNRGGAK